MKYASALKEPALAALWVSQVFSGLGDQLYMLAAMWIGVQRFGNNAAYIAAAIGIGRITFGLLGGTIADRFDRRRIMIFSDIVRFLAVAPLSFLAFTGTIHLWHLIVAGALMGSFGAFFDPALQASLPSITRTQSALEAMTGLMDLTQRLARALGPGLTGALVMIMPITQFFTIEAVSFLISGLTIFWIGLKLSCDTGDKTESFSTVSSPRRSILKETADGLRYVGQDKAMAFCFLNLALVAGLWGIAFTVGMPILVKQSFNDNVANYGYLTAIYGVGSVIGNVACANLHVRCSWLNIFAGDALCGVGFVLIGAGHSIEMAATGAILAAIGGASGDLLLLNRIMKDVPASLLGKVMSLRMMTLAGGHSLGLLMAAALFRLASASVIIGLSGALMFVTCVIGAIAFANYRKEIVEA